MLSGLGIQILDTYFVGMRAAGKSSRDTKGLGYSECI